MPRLLWISMIYIYIYSIWQHIAAPRKMAESSQSSIPARRWASGTTWMTFGAVFAAHKKSKTEMVWKHHREIHDPRFVVLWQTYFVRGAVLFALVASKNGCVFGWPPVPVAQVVSAKNELWKEKLWFHLVSVYCVMFINVTWHRWPMERTMTWSFLLPYKQIGLE